MTNKELRDAVARIAQLKIYAAEGRALKERILAEFKIRSKNKINLGGPTKEDYIKLNETPFTKYLPCDVYSALIDSGKSEETAIGIILQNCNITKKEINKYLPEVLELIEPVTAGQKKQISYRVSSDEKNMVRGIDL